MSLLPMSSSRTPRCFRTRTIVCCFILLMTIGLYILYQAHVKTVDFIKKQHFKCLSEQDTLYGNLREESLAKYKAESDLKSGKKALTDLKETHTKERVVLKVEVNALQVQLEDLKLECSKYEKQARERHEELENVKVILSETQKQLNNQLMSKNLVIDLLKQDKKKLKDVIKKLKGDNAFPFYYPQSKSVTRNIAKQVDIGNDEFKVMIQDKDKKSPYDDNRHEPIALNLHNLVNAQKPKSTTKSMLVKKDAGDIISRRIHPETRPLVPNGVAPEIIVNDEKYKNGDDVIKSEISNENKHKISDLGEKNNDEGKPNRYKTKLDKAELKFDENKVDSSVIKFPLKVGYQEDKHGIFHFGDDRNSFDNAIDNHAADNNINDVNISLDQAEPGLPVEEDDDDYDDFDKANFQHQAEN